MYLHETTEGARYIAKTVSDSCHVLRHRLANLLAWVVKIYVRIRSDLEYAGSTRVLCDPDRGILQSVDMRASTYLARLDILGPPLAHLERHWLKTLTL